MGRPPKRIPAAGDVFERLTVLAVPSDLRLTHSKWPCSCVCGELFSALGKSLVQGLVRSCGCLDRDNKKARQEFFRTRHAAKISWKRLLRDSTQPTWTSFEGFFADLGERPSGTVLSRYDLDGPYTAANCFWEERRAQIRRLHAKQYADAAALTVKDGSTKRCPKCREEKSLDDFYVNNAAKNKRQSRCKVCTRAWHIAYDRENQARLMVDRARTRAREKGFEFALRPEQLEPLPTHCPVFGIALTCGNGHQDPSAYSLDRIDNSRGYVSGNVVVMSYLANRLKNDGTAEQHTQIAQWMRNSGDVSTLANTAGISMGLL